MARFNVGQIVELADSCFGEVGVEGLLQTGDRGTVVVGGRMNDLGVMWARVLWHRIGSEVNIVENEFRVYTHPADAPGH